MKNRLRYYQSQYKLQDADIEDLEQTIWLKIYAGLDNYNSQYRFWSWMRQLLRTELQRLYKKGKRYLISDESVRLIVEKNQTSKKNNIDNWVDDENIRFLLSPLNDREREVLVRHLFKGETQVEIAKDFGAVKSRINQIYLGAVEKINNCKNPNI